MREEVNPKNDQGLFGHDHLGDFEGSTESKVEAVGNTEAVIIPFPNDSDEEVNLNNKNNWHTPVAFGIFAGMLGGIMAIPTIEMIESENGFNTEVPGNLGVGAFVVASALFISTTIYKHFRP